MSSLIAPCHLFAVFCLWVPGWGLTASHCPVRRVDGSVVVHSAAHTQSMAIGMCLPLQVKLPTHIHCCCYHSLGPLGHHDLSDGAPPPLPGDPLHHSSHGPLSTWLLHWTLPWSFNPLYVSETPELITHSFCCRFCAHVWVWVGVGGSGSEQCLCAPHARSALHRRISGTPM